MARSWPSFALAEQILKLSAYPFKAIGQLNIDPEMQEHFIGPFYASLCDIDRGYTKTLPVDGIYTSAYLSRQDSIARAVRAVTSTSELAHLHLLRTYVPDPSFDGAPFYLFHPDFNFQNILVDMEGNVTGIIDWDNAYVGPRQTAFACYPSWLTCDWDPAVYVYTEAAPDNQTNGQDFSRESQQADSPEDLQQFRSEYLAAVNQVDETFGKLTQYSHVTAVIDLAVLSSFLRPYILEKLTKYTFGDKDDDLYLSWASLSERMSTGQWMKDAIGKERLVEGGKYV